MKKCDICGMEYSDKVYKIHRTRCKATHAIVKKEVKEETVKEIEVEEDSNESDIRARAKELGIRSYHNKKIDKLVAEIAERELVM